MNVSAIQTTSGARSGSGDDQDAATERSHRSPPGPRENVHARDAFTPSTGTDIGRQADSAELKTQQSGQVSPGTPILNAFSVPGSGSEGANASVNGMSTNGPRLVSGADGPTELGDSPPPDPPLEPKRTWHIDDVMCTILLVIAVATPAILLASVPASFLLGWLNLSNVGAVAFSIASLVAISVALYVYDRLRTSRDTPVELARIFEDAKKHASDSSNTSRAQ